MSGRNRIIRILFSLFLGVTCLACGLEQDISIGEPEASSPEGPSVIVAWDKSVAEVFLGDLDKVEVNDTPVCLLRDILLSAGLEEEDIRSMLFDFESEDGFRPTSVGCDPLEGETLELGYLDPESMALVWDASLGLRGCYWVTQMARIFGEPA